MRRQYGGNSAAGNSYGSAAEVASIHHHQRMEQQPSGGASDFEGRLEAFTPERETNPNPNPNPYAPSKPGPHWRWERDAPPPKSSNPLTPNLYNEGQVGDTSRSYFQGQRSDPKHGLETQSNSDPRSQTHFEDMDLGYEDKASSQSFEDVEQKFLDDIRKLTKEQNDAEDAENARHRERLGTINAQYEAQLASLRCRHDGRRDNLLRRESNARQHQYQQSVMDRYPKSSMVSSDLHGYSGIAASTTGGDAQRGYEADQYGSYRERARFLGGSRDHGFEPRGPYPGACVYDTGSRYY